MQKEMKYLKRWSRSRVHLIHFNYSDFMDLDIFIDRIWEELSIGEDYCILLKAEYNDGEYGMVTTEKVPFNLSEFDDEKIVGLHGAFYKALNEFSDEYGVDSIQIIQVMYVNIVYRPE